MNALGIDRLRSFVAVADRNSISGAASKVARTQSAISMQMRNLEEALGGKLLKRTRRGVRLTRKGEHLLKHARAILNLHDRALAELSGSVIVGDVRLGCPDDYAQFLPDALSDFAARHPLIQVHLKCAPTPDLLRDVETGELDLAVITTRRARKTQIIRREPLVWVGRADAALIEHPVLPLAVSHEESIDRFEAIEALRRAKRAYKIVYASRSMPGLIAAVDAGIAIAVLTRSVVPRNLAILHEGLPQLPEVDVALAVSSSQPAVAVQQLAARLRQMPGRPE